MSDDQFIKQALNTIEATLDNAIDRHNKLTVIRLDVRYDTTSKPEDSNHDISKLSKNIKQNLNNRWIDANVIWAREQKTSENPHYHMGVLVDGNKVQSPHDIAVMASKSWKHITGSDKDGLVHRGSCTSIRRPSSKAEGTSKKEQERQFQKQRQQALDTLSYLAKTATKDQTPPHAKRFHASLPRRQNKAQDNEN